MAGLRRTGSLLVIALMLTGCASSSSRLAKLHKSTAESQEQTWARAQLYEHDGRYAEAQQLYAELYRRDSKSPQYAHRLGVVCTMMSDHERANSAYLKAKELDPTNPELLADMGYAAYLQKNYAEAETLLRASLAQVAQNPRAKSNLALAVGCQGRYDESLALFREVHGQDEAEILCNLAYVKSQRGDIIEAAQLYKQVLAIDPSFTKASAALAQLKAAETPAQAVAEKKPYRKYMQKTVADAAPAPSKPVFKEAAAGVAQVPATEPTAEERKSAVIQTADQVEQDAGVSTVTESGDLAFWSEGEADLNQPAPTAAPRKFPVEEPVTTPVVQKPVIQKPAPQAIETHTVATEETPITVVEAPAEITAPAVLENEAQSALEEPRPLRDGWAAVQPGLPDQFGPEMLQSRMEQLVARSGQPGFMGFCPVALRDEQKLADALPQYTAEHQSQKYQFNSEDAAKKFLAKPERYLPAAGGLDVVAVSQGTAVAQGSLEHALWFRHKLYLFLNRENMELFRAQARAFAVQE